MSNDEFIIPSNENNIVKYGIVGIVVVVILGTIYCFMTKKLMFKNKKVEKVENFQPVVVDYDSKVETIIQNLMKGQGLYTKNNKFIIQNIKSLNSPVSPEVLYKSYEKMHPYTREEIVGKIRNLLGSQGLIDKLKGKISEIFSNNEKQINDKQLNVIALKISHEKDGGEDFLKTCASISNEGPVPIGAESPSDKIVNKLMEYGGMD